jgi:hypothetical protein
MLGWFPGVGSVDAIRFPGEPFRRFLRGLEIYAVDLPVKSYRIDLPIEGEKALLTTTVAARRSMMERTTFTPWFPRPGCDEELLQRHSALAAVFRASLFPKVLIARRATPVVQGKYDRPRDQGQEARENYRRGNPEKCSRIAVFQEGESHDQGDKGKGYQELPATPEGEKSPDFGLLSIGVLHRDLPVRKWERTFPFFIGR